MLRKNLVVRKNFVPLHPQLSNKGVADTGCSAVGSVPGLGPGCRRFESCHPDEENTRSSKRAYRFNAVSFAASCFVAVLSIRNYFGLVVYVLDL